MSRPEDREVFEVYAIRYAHRGDRTRSSNFVYKDEHDAPMPLDYFVWLIRNDRHTFVADTGFGQRASAERGSPLLRSPAEGLKLMGVDAAEVENVILTHMHYDHAGGLDAFPNANLHVQQTEMQFATGPCMCFEAIKKPFDVEDVVTMVRRLYDGRVTFHDGDVELMPGLSLHKIGGHSDGLQAVRVWTQRGWVVLASDASHFYENMLTNNPFIIVYNMGDVLNGYHKLFLLGETKDHVIPGHDPKVREYYPAPSEDLQGIVMRLDVEPNTSVA